MWVAFAKATHIFSAKIIRILYIESAKIVNEMTFNELVKLTTLWTTGLWNSWRFNRVLSIDNVIFLLMICLKSIEKY